MRKKLLAFLTMFFLCARAFAAPSATLTSRDGTEKGTAANPLYVTLGASVTIGSSSGFIYSNAGTLTFVSMADDQIIVADSATGATARTVPDCDDSSGNHINYDTATNTFSCGTSSSTASGWSYSSPNITLGTGTDNVGIGGSPLAKFSVDGDTDEIQALVQGHSTQTSFLFVAENSAGTDKFTIDNSGNVVIAGTLTVGGSSNTTTLGDASGSTYALASNLSGSNDPTLTFIDAGWKWGANSEDLSCTFGTNAATCASSTGVTSLTYTSIGITTGAASNLSAGTTTLGTVAANGTITLAENSSLALDPAGSADGKYTGITVTGTSGYSQSFGDLVYLDPTDSRWEAVDANSASGADGDARGLIGMVVSTGTDGNSCTILLNGIIRADAKFPTFTVNNPIYASETAGSVTQTQPTTTDVVIKIVGAALTADEMYFNPDNTWTTHT